MISTPAIDFFESYKKLDNLCKTQFHTEEGISDYIASMEKQNESRGYDNTWYRYLKSLKSIRHLRNQYAHDEDAFYELDCPQEMQDFVFEFYNLVLAHREPLSLLSQSCKSKQSNVLETNYEINVGENLFTNEKKRQKRRTLIVDDDDESLGGMGYIVFIVISIVFIILFAFHLV